MASKPYSFRFPYDVQSAFDRWRPYLTGKLGETQDYETVISFLRDRDRALEDYLSLGIGQGQLGLGTQPVGSITILAADTFITGQTVTFSVPANRQIRITGAVSMYHSVAGNATGFYKIKDENLTTLTSEYYFFAGVGTPSGKYTLRLSHFYTPDPGIHTVTGWANMSDSNGVAEQIANTNFLQVEDIGPASR